MTHNPFNQYTSLAQRWNDAFRRNRKLPDAAALKGITPLDVQALDKDLRYELFGDAHAELVPAMLEIEQKLTTQIPPLPGKSIPHSQTTVSAPASTPPYENPLPKWDLPKLPTFPKTPGPGEPLSPPSPPGDARPADPYELHRKLAEHDRERFRRELKAVFKQYADAFAKARLIAVGVGESIDRYIDDFIAYYESLSPEEQKRVRRELLLTASTFLPFVGDAIGLGLDLYDMKDPEERSIENISLMALGLIPGVPSLKRAKRAGETIHDGVKSARTPRGITQKGDGPGMETPMDPPDNYRRKEKEAHDAFDEGNRRLRTKAIERAAKCWKNETCKEVFLSAAWAAIWEAARQYLEEDPSWKKLLSSSASGGASGAINESNKHWFKKFVMEAANNATLATANKSFEPTDSTFKEYVIAGRYEFGKTIVKNVVIGAIKVGIDESARRMKWPDNLRIAFRQSFVAGADQALEVLLAVAHNLEQPSPDGSTKTVVDAIKDGVKEGLEKRRGRS